MQCFGSGVLAFMFSAMQRIGFPPFGGHNVPGARSIRVLAFDFSSFQDLKPLHFRPYELLSQAFCYSGPGRMKAVCWCCAWLAEHTLRRKSGSAGKSGAPGNHKKMHEILV